MSAKSSRDGDESWFSDQIASLVDQGRMAEAVQRLESCLETEDPVQIVKAAAVLNDAGEHQVARGAMEAAVRRYPRLWLAQRHLGRLCLDQEDLPKAVDCLTEAARLRPEPIALTFLGYAQSCLGNTEEAKAAYRRALEIDPSYEEAAYNLATHLADSDPAEAKSLFRSALHNDPDYGIAHQQLGILLLKQGRKRLAEAEEHLRRAVELLRDDPWPSMYLGNCLWQRRRLMQALDAFKQAARIAPDLSAPLWAMANIQHARGNLDDAIELNRRALDIDPNDHVALTNMGAYMIDLDDLPAARVCLQRALVSNPNMKRARRLLSTIDDSESGDS